MDGDTTQHQEPDEPSDGVVVRRSERGWLVGGEETTDLTSARVLADLLAADLGSPPGGAGRHVPPARAARKTKQPGWP